MFKRPQGMTAFTLVWAGQLVSLLGTSMTQFALTIWSWKFVTEVHPVDDPATAMALVALFNMAPLIFFSPIAGALVDRWNRKLVMMVSDLAAGLATIAVFLLYSSGQLQIWHLYIAGAFTGLFQSFQWPAYSAAIATMIPKEHYTRADSMMGLNDSLSGIFAPMLAGLLLTFIGISGIMLLDIITFLVAIAALLAVVVPQPPVSETGAASRGSLRSESVYGFRYIFERKSLLGLQLVFFTGNLLATVAGTLFAPMILSRSGNDSVVLGTVQAALGAGGLIGGLVLTIRGGLKRQVHGVLMGWVIASLFGTVLLGLGQTLTVWIAAAFISSLFGPLINGSNQSIWQAKVPPDVQGKVFAARRMIAWLTIPVAQLIAGPLADRVFEPGLRAGGNLVPLFGGLVGVGPGVGMALITVICGLLAAVLCGSGYLFPVIRNAEDLLPDHDAAPSAG